LDDIDESNIEEKYQTESNGKKLTFINKYKSMNKIKKGLKVVKVSKSFKSIEI